MGKRTIEAPDGFASAMQQFSAEAAKKSSAATPEAAALAGGTALTELRTEVQTLAERLEGWELAFAAKIEQLAATAEMNSLSASEHFQKLHDQLHSMRSTESVNQRLFDSLHDELLKYRDNFLHESLQKPFIHDLVHLFDDLTSLSEQLQRAAEDVNARGNVTQWRDNLENAIHSLVEILHRFDVKEIEPRERVDRTVHKIVNFESADFPEEDGCIVMRVRRGFFWRGKLIRPEEVVAKRFG